MLWMRMRRVVLLDVETFDRDQIALMGSVIIWGRRPLHSLADGYWSLYQRSRA
jgi:hypothetical protein